MTVPDAETSSVGIVTVSYNSSGVLGTFLDSARQDAGRHIPIVIADNGSSDIDESRRLSAMHDATLLALGENHGYGGAINRAVAQFPPEISAILISNPDVILGAGTVGVLAGTLATHPDAGAVGPLVQNPDGSIYPSARSLPSLRTGVGHAVFGRVWRTNPWTARYLSDTANSPTLTRTGWLSGSCLLVRRTAFEAVGGFDERYFMYFEDVDLGYRLGKAGWVNYFQPGASVVHSGAHSTSSESGRMISAHHQSARLYLRRKYSAWYLAPVRWVLSAGLAIRSRWLQRPRSAR